MTTTNANNPSARQAPTLGSSSKGLSSNDSHALVTIYFRQSSDGANFTVTPVYLPPQDAGQAIGRAPHEYSLSATVFAAWPNSYNNSAQPVGGRGRLLGVDVAAG